MFPLMSRVAPIALSVAARAALFLVLSWYVYAFAEAGAAADFFQDMFFQSVLITFLSASSFFAVVSKGWDTSKDTLLMLTHCFMAIITIVVVGLLYWVGDLGIPGGILLALLVGALATGLAAPLTGVIMRRHGTWVAYGPSIVLAPLFLGFLAIPGSDTILTCVLAIVGFQVSVFVVVAYVGRDVVLGTFRLQSAGRTSETARALWSTFVFGALNAAFVGYFYWFRELWVEVQPAEIAAAVLFVYRIFDTLLGIVIVDLGSRFNVMTLVDRQAQRLMLPVVSLGAVVLLLLSVLEVSTLSPLAVALAGQFTLECARLPMIIFFLYQSARRSGIGYIAYIVGTVGLSYAVLAAVPLQVQTTGFFAFLAVTNVISALITCVHAATWPNTPAATGRSP